MINKGLCILTIALLLTGCVGTQYQYKGSLPDSQIAKVRASTENSVWYPFVSAYFEVDKVDGDREWVSVGNHFTGFSAKLNVLPGNYLVQFYCASGGTYAYPVAPLRAEAGKTYESRCFNAVGGKVGAEIKESTAATN